MKTITLRKLLCLLLVVLLAAAVLTGCSAFLLSAKKDTQKEEPKTETKDVTVTKENGENVPDPTDEAKPADANELGEGGKVIYFDVTFSDGSTSSYTIHTDAATVGEALLDEELIAGEESQYGLYVKTVVGETLDYDADGMYWAFYENGEYAMTGVDATQITDGATYAFMATKG